MLLKIARSVLCALALLHVGRVALVLDTLNREAQYLFFWLLASPIRQILWGGYRDAASAAVVFSRFMSQMLVTDVAEWPEDNMEVLNNEAEGGDAEQTEDDDVPFLYPSDDWQCESCGFRSFLWVELWQCGHCGCHSSIMHNSQ